MHDTTLLTWNCHDICHASICKDKFFLRKNIMNSQKTNFRKKNKYKSLQNTVA